MASKILIASLLLLMLLALGASSPRSSEKDVQEFNTWNKGYQLDNLDMSLDMTNKDVQDTDYTTELKEGLKEDSERGKRAAMRTSTGSQSTHQTTSVPVSTPSPSPSTIKRCGPDVTSWLIRQMNRNKNHIEIKRCRSWYKYFFWPRCLLKFAGLVGNGKPWDFKRTQNFRRGPCPTQCPRTVTLCNHCVNYDVPGNIHYGWVGRAATIRRWLLLYAADRVQKGGVDDPKDQNAIKIGMDLWDVPRKRRRFCREVNRKIKVLNLQGTDGCNICNIKY